MNPASYSLSWANEVVRKLKRKHPRGTELVEKMLGLTDRNLAKYLSDNDEMWPDLRDMVKQVEVWTEIHGQKWSYYTLVTYFCQLFERKGKIRLVNRLKSLAEGAILEEQGSRGAGGGGEADDSRLQLFLDF